MQKLSAELSRLYLSDAGAADHTRAIVIAFDDWSLLCTVANALQTELALPAPAVSISGKRGFRLWLSFEAPVAAALAGQFLAALHAAYFPDVALAADALAAPNELPPFLHKESGLWAAFINPGLGASFADESGLEMAPPLAAQAALLESVHSISAAQLQHAMQQLAPAAPPATSAPQGLLLKDATLEDIVRHLHSLHIEPTFRHLVKR
jgi:hypothetical protein